VNGLRLSEVDFEQTSGTSFSITSRSGGELARIFNIDEQGSTSRTRFTVVGGTLVYSGGDGRWNLSGGTSDGLGMNSTQAAGISGANLFTSQIQRSGEVRLTLTGQPANNQALRIDNGLTGVNSFAFRTVAAPTNDLQIQIGANVEETINNAVIKLTEWVEKSLPTRLTEVMRQLDFQREGNDLVIRYKGIGNATDINEANAAFAETITNGSLSAASMSNGVNSGVNVQGVINPDFVGKVQGFTAEMVAANTVELSLTVGSSTYSATTRTNFSAGQTIRMISDEGGYFDMIMKAGSNAVANQSDADALAATFDAAFDSLSFYQERTISDFGARDIFVGSKLTIRTNDYDTPLQFESVKVVGYDDNSTASKQTAKIEMVINGERYESVSTIEEQIDPYQKIVLENVNNSEKKITFTNSVTPIAIKSSFDAKKIEDAFRNQLPLAGTIGSKDVVSFQIESENETRLNYTIETVSSGSLFGEEKISIATAEDALKAVSLVQAAIDVVTGRRAYVGSLQARNDYTYSALESAATVHESARAVIADTDITKESTAFAQNMVKVQASITVGAQSNVLRSTVLDIVNAGNLDMSQFAGGQPA
jgi:flagellin-like hook-associated protein FlgL